MSLTSLDGFKIKIESILKKTNSISFSAPSPKVFIDFPIVWDEIGPKLIKFHINKVSQTQIFSEFFDLGVDFVVVYVVNNLAT